MRRQPGGCGVRVISCRRGEGREPAFHFPIQRSGGWARRVKAEDRMSPKAGEEQKEPLLEQTGGVPGTRDLCAGVQGSGSEGSASCRLTGWAW